MNIILIRHGETVWNAEHRFQGKTDTKLNEEGLRQADLLAERMKHFEVDRIYSSDLERAIITAEKIGAVKNLPVIQTDYLREIDFGKWEGMTLSEIMDKHTEEYNKCRKDPIKYGFHYGLPFDEVKNKTAEFIEKYIYGCGCENIVVVSHSVVLKMLLVLLLDFPPQTFHTFYLSNCAISIVHESSIRKVLLKFNDDYHINEGAKITF